MFELMDAHSQSAVIKVIGVGGGGGNAVSHMVETGIEGVEFICANTDSQALQGMSARTTLQIGADITKGLGAGANPDVGRQAAQEDRDRIAEVIEGSDMLFITAGIGNGSVFHVVPNVFRKLHERTAEGQDQTAQEAAITAGDVEASVALGFTSAIAALGLFFIPAFVATSIQATGSAHLAISVFSLFYLSCVLATWWWYKRKDAEVSCD